MSSDIAIRVENLSKCYHIYDNPRDRLKQMFFWGRRQYYREFWALKDVSFEVPKGETVGIIGCNGSGKSTLLQSICGTLNPSGGIVEAYGRVAALLELGSGFNPEFTGRENVYMNAAVLGLTPAEIEETFPVIADFAAIGQFMEQPIKTYSSGMVMRLAFSVQASVEPDILIVDEALSVGDIRFQNKCIRKMEEIKQRGTTILFVTHSTSMVEAFCDRVLWLREGSLFKDGDPSTLVRQYVNLLSHGIEDEHRTIKQRSRVPLELGGEAGWECITPQHNVRNRHGVEIESVRMVDEADAAILDRLGDSIPHDVVLEVVVHAGCDIVSPLFGLCIHNEMNEPVVHFNNCAAGQVLSPLRAGQRYRAAYRFKLPPLREGRYLVSVGLDDGVPGANTLLCHVYDAWLLSVERPHLVYKQAGYVQLENTSVTCKPL